jgi:hypothetical protein
MLNKREFKKASLVQRYNELKNNGEHAGVRQQGAHNIHLFTYNGFYVEIYILISFNQVHWIEIQENQGIINSYAEKIDIKKDLGLDI